MKLPTLYSRSVTGAVQQWTVIVNGNEYWTEAGQVGGAITTNKPQVCAGKNIGKANETSPDEQAEKEAQAAWKKKKKEGYTEDINKIDEQVFFQPMLAKQFDDYREKIVYPVGVEDKLNGIRSVHFKRGSFSRTGEEFHNIRHIRDSIKSLFDEFPDLVLDGELFNYKYRNLLNRIAQLVAVTRKPKDITPELRQESEDIVRLYVYDGFGFTIDGKEITQDTPFWQRKQGLKKLLEQRKHVFVLDYHFAKSEEDIIKALKHSKDNGWEGIIIRIFDAPYENKRSKYLLKYKNFIDKEFEVLDILPGTGNWTGCAKKIVCKLDKPGKNGETEFTSNIRGSMEELKDLYENRSDYIGKKIYATVEFQEYSEYGIPLIPYTQLPFRIYE